MQKMIGQASIPQGAVATLQAPIEPGFQSSAGHGYALVADLFLLTTIAMLQSLLHQGLYLTRKLASCFLAKRVIFRQRRSRWARQLWCRACTNRR